MKVIPWNGQVISEPGVYSGIPMAIYHGQLCTGPSVSSSGLRTIFYESAKHYFRDSYLNPKRKPQKVKEAYIFGRGAHHLLLGEEGFSKMFVIRPLRYPSDKDTDLFWRPTDDDPGKEWAGQANWCKAWVGVAEWFGLTILTSNDIENIRGMADSLAEDPMVQSGILGGLIEHSFVWQDKETGIWLKWRPDSIPTDSMDFADLKTAAGVSDEELERTIGAYGYQMQGALGAIGCREVLGQEMSSFTLVFGEKTDPWCTRTKTIRAPDIELGERQVRTALRYFRKCLDTGVWPGPGGTQTDTEYSGLSEWAGRRAQARIDEIERELT